MAYPLSVLDLIAQYKVKSSTCEALHYVIFSVPVSLPLLNSVILSTMFSNTVPSIPLRVKDQVSSSLYYLISF